MRKISYDGIRKIKAHGNKIIVGVTCIDCGEIIPMYGSTHWNRLVCDDCEIIRERKFSSSYGKKMRWDNKQVIVMKTCIDCGELVVAKINYNNRCKDRCNKCEYEVSGRVRNEDYTPDWKIGKCRYCNKEIVKRTKNQVFCSKCKEIYSIMYTREYCRAFREHIRKNANRYYRNVIKKNKPKRFCICGKDITKTRRRKYCKDCAKEVFAEQSSKNAREYYRNYKYAISDRVVNRPGTNATRKKFSLKRKKNGKPNWAAEKRDIEKIKRKTYRKPNEVYVLEGDKIRFSKKQLDKIYDGEY